MCAVTLPELLEPIVGRPKQTHLLLSATAVQTAAVVRGRTHQQLLRRSLISWQLAVKHRHQKLTADAYAASKLQQQVFLAWADAACQARSKASAAVNMAARVQARVHNQLLLHCFAAWHERMARAVALKVRLSLVWCGWHMCV